jgi:hypothetical protein
VAPVCPVSRSQTPPNTPANIFTYVPKPIDLPSAIAAANQLAQVLQPLAGLGAAPNNVFPPFMPVPRGSPIVGVLKKTQRWQEKTRQTATIRFYATDDNGQVDKEQWIEVKRIVHIVWHDKVQGIDLTVDWPYDPQQEEGSKLMKMEPAAPPDTYYALLLSNPP